MGHPQRPVGRGTQSRSAVFKPKFGTIPCFRCPDYDFCAVFCIPFVDKVFYHSWGHVACSWGGLLPLGKPDNVAHSF